MQQKMLKFTPLLCIATSIVNLNRASHQSPNDYREFQVSVHSPLISKPRVMPRRLQFFESITKSEDQRDDDFPASIGSHEGCLAPEHDKSVNEILRHSLIELAEIMRTLKTNDPFKAMRLPVHATPVQTPESLEVFQSLLMMLSNPKESRSSKPWQQYLRESISKHQGSETDLCREFQPIFKCGGEGHLRVIMLDGKGPFDHLNLLMIPNTVKALYLRRTKLKTISEWNGLKGNHWNRCDWMNTQVI